MIKINQEKNGLFESLKEVLFDCDNQIKTKENLKESDLFLSDKNEDHRFDFLVQDMFFEHFFP